MFTQLLASQPVQQKSTGGLLASIVLHLVLATGVVYATTKSVEVIEAERPIDLVYRTPEPDPVPQLEPPIAVQPTVVETVNMGLPPILREIPHSLPPLTWTLVPTVERSFIPGASFAPHARPLPRGLPGTPDGVFREEQVEEPVTLAKGSPVPRYPSALSATGIDGAARFRFIVDTAGRVEMSSVEQVAASHSAFGQAVWVTLPRLRFTPARVDGRTVRQLVELPFEFRTKR